MFPARSGPAAGRVFNGDARHVDENRMTTPPLSAARSRPWWLWRYASTCQRDRPTRIRFPMRVGGILGW